MAKLGAEINLDKLSKRGFGTTEKTEMWVRTASNPDL